MSLLPVYASEVLGWGSGGLGLLFGAMGAGAVATAAVIPQVREYLRRTGCSRWAALWSRRRLVALALMCRAGCS